MEILHSLIMNKAVVAEVTEDGFNICHRNADVKYLRVNSREFTFVFVIGDRHGSMEKTC